MDSSLDQELKRYDAVIFFESAAVGDLDIEGGNPTRVENIQQARELDKKLHQVWSQHPNFHYIPHQTSFFSKLNAAFRTLQDIIKGLGSQN